MTDRLAPTLPPPGDVDAGLTLWLPDLEPEAPTLPAPTILAGPPVPDGPLTYGLVAKVTLARPGFGFRIEHDLPADVDLIEARPRATVVGDHLIWQMGRVDPGQEIRLEIVVQPRPGAVLRPGDLATFEGTFSQNLYFQAPVVRSKAAARWAGPARVGIGEVVEFTLDVVGTGNWPGGEVRAAIQLPAEFDHPDGPRFEYALGSLKPKEYRRVRIPARAVAAGLAVLRAVISGPGDHEATVEFKTTVE